MRNSKLLRHFLDAVNVAAVAVMLAVLLIIAKETLIEWQSISIAIVAVFLTFKTKISTIWTIVIGANLGFLLLTIV
nr:chromate transporter [Winogradskyella forsetii]